MKKLLTILTYLALAAVVIGSVFKILHWPGAGILFVCGNLLFFILGIIWLFWKKRDYVMIILGITLLLTFVAGTFKIQHWPGAGYLTWAVVFMVPILATVLYNKKE